LLKKKRQTIHLLMALIIIFVIVLFGYINNQAVIAQLFTLAGYTYGPLLGLYSFGLFTKIQVNDKWIPAVAILSPLISHGIKIVSSQIFSGYHMGFEFLILNGLVTFLGLWLLRKRKINNDKLT